MAASELANDDGDDGQTAGSATSGSMVGEQPLEVVTAILGQLHRLLVQLRAKSLVDTPSA